MSHDKDSSSFHTTGRKHSPGACSCTARDRLFIVIRHMCKFFNSTQQCCDYIAMRITCTDYSHNDMHATSGMTYFIMTYCLRHISYFAIVTDSRQESRPFVSSPLLIGCLMSQFYSLFHAAIYHTMLPDKLPQPVVRLSLLKTTACCKWTRHAERCRIHTWTQARTVDRSVKI